MTNQHKAIGALLRRWRERITPERVGLSPGPGRRVAGRHRQELARLAGVSPDYLTQLEQGRATSPSPEILVALAHALQLSPTESDHVLQLAGYRPSTAPATTVPSTHVLRLVDQLAAAPAAVHDRCWNPAARNLLSTAIHGDPGDRAGRQHNMVWRLFSGSPNRVLRADSDMQQLYTTPAGDLRARLGYHPDDAALNDLIAESKIASPVFHDMWDAADIDTYRHEAKTFAHPRAGILQLDCDILRVGGEQDLRLILYTRQPHSRSADQLRRLHESSAA
ncbi:helix-turn-helix transcriptional regulator [soil metagenome]